MLTLENAATAQVDFEILAAGKYIECIKIPNAVSNPVDLDAILAKLEGTVRYAPLATSGLLSNIDPLRIWVNDKDPHCRQLITIGHEIGHYFLGRIADPATQVSWGRVDARLRYDDSQNDAVEAFCDYFAHRLIGMPECLVK